MRVRILGAHNLESKETALTCLLVDDTLALDAGALTSNLPLEIQRRLEAVLLSHHHYDHIRDIPILAMSFFSAGSGIDIYATETTATALTAYLLDGRIYLNFLERPADNPALRLHVVEPSREFEVAGYRVLPVPMQHALPSVGYQVTSADGKSLFYTSDTGGGLDDCWQRVTPRLLITEVTLPNEFADAAREAGHLTPDLLRQEMESFRRIRGYLPQIVAVHINPDLEHEIETQLADVAEALDTPISLGYEGMLLDL